MLPQFPKVSGPSFCYPKAAKVGVMERLQKKTSRI